MGIRACSWRLWLSRAIRCVLRYWRVDAGCVALSVPFTAPLTTVLVLFNFLGSDYTIFRAATIGRLALLAQYDGKPDNDSKEARRFYWGKAQEFFGTYYKAYGDRFATIRHPLEFGEPLGLEGFEEPLTIEFGDIVPWETAEWKEHREKLKNDASKRFPIL